VCVCVCVCVCARVRAFRIHPAAVTACACQQFRQVNTSRHLSKGWNCRVDVSSMQRNWPRASHRHDKLQGDNACYSGPNEDVDNLLTLRGTFILGSDTGYPHRLLMLLSSNTRFNFSYPEDGGDIFLRNVGRPHSVIKFETLSAE
jgi:hypothetical protein